MKKTIAFLAIFILVVALFLPGCNVGSKEVDVLEAEVIKLKVEKGIAENDMKELEDKVSVLESEKAEALEKIEDLENQGDSVFKDERDAALAEAEKLGNELDAALDNIKELEDSSLDSVFPEDFRDSEVVSDWEVATLQFTLRGEVTAVDIPKRIITLSRGADSLAVYVRPDAFSGDPNVRFRIEELIIEEKITIIAFYTVSIDTVEGVVVYRGDNPLNRW